MSAEVNWLRRLSGVSKLESRRNEEVRQELGQMVTLIERIRQRRLQWLGRVERTNNDGLLIRALHTGIERTKKSRKRMKGMD